MPDPALALPCDHRHDRPGSGRLDETARRVSHEELAVAQALVAEGHDVRSVRDGRGRGRQADLTVCGTPVEIKSFVPEEALDGGPPNAYHVANKVAKAAGQARHVVIYDAGRGLTEEAARLGLVRLAAKRPPVAASLSSVRVMGEGLDLAWARRPGLERATPRSAASAPTRRPETPGLEVGL